MADRDKGTALVTGASKGIGVAVARRLARDGFAVAVNYSHSADEANDVVRDIEGEGGRAVAIQADVGDASQMTRLFDEAELALGPATVIVNNAGIMDLAPLAEFDDERFERIMATNLRGVFNGMREAARRLPDGGRIISFSSSVVGTFFPTYSLYGATKSAVEAMTHVLAKELGPRQINVNVVAPGPVATDLFLAGKSEEQIAGIIKLIPFGRLGEPDDIARVVSFLAGPDSRWVNGQVLRANGGMI